jgi:acyl-CoA thioester hydrolase
MIRDYPLSARIEVRWRDVDALGHVNNAVYFTYLEIARTLYLERVFDVRRLEEIPILLVSARCDFLSPVTHGETLEVGVRIPSVGNTSFDFEYELRSAPEGRLVARASSTQVLFDHAAGRKVPITEAWLDRVEAAQGQRPERRTRSVSGA